MMKPEEIIPKVDEGVPSNAREGLREIVEKYEIDEELTSRNNFFIEDRDIKFEIQDSSVDLDKGQELIAIRISTPEVGGTILAEDVWVSEVMVKIRGKHKHDSFTIFP